jgi:hypothetical protein
LISGGRTPGSNGNGWNNSDVLVSFSCADGLSGIDTNTVGGGTVSGEGAAQSLTNTGTCIDNGGNAALPVTIGGINIDKTPPVISLTSRLPAANSFGWNNSSVTVTWSCSDSLSGPASSSVSQTVTSEGINQSANGTCKDLADNMASTTQDGISIDEIAPTLSPLITPTPPLLLNGTATATAGAVDSLSGVDSQSCATPDTSTVGNKKLLCTASDKAGNVATNDSVPYVVQYASGAACYGGPGHQILPPINVDGSSVFKQKSTVPAKFRVCDANGASIGTTGVVSRFWLFQKINGTTSLSVNEEIVSTTPDTVFRWDPTDQQWIFNINTKNLTANTTYGYRIDLNDGTFIPFSYGLK